MAVALGERWLQPAWTVGRRGRGVRPRGAGLAGTPPGFRSMRVRWSGGVAALNHRLQADIPPGCEGMGDRWSGGVAVLNHRLQADIPSGCEGMGGAVELWCRGSSAEVLCLFLALGTSSLELRSPAGPSKPAEAGAPFRGCRGHLPSTIPAFLGTWNFSLGTSSPLELPPRVGGRGRLPPLVGWGHFGPRGLFLTGD